MTDLDQMSANLRAISLAVAASDGSPEELFSFLEETGYPPLDICRFILTSSETEMKRIMFVRVVGFFFDYLTRMDFDAIFSEGWAMGINPYSYIFAYRGGGTPSSLASTRFPPQRQLGFPMSGVTPMGCLERRP